MLQGILRRARLPSVVLGPRDFAPLFGLAAACAGLLGAGAQGAAFGATAAPAAASTLLMTGFLAGWSGSRSDGACPAR
jgi:hypothetical protein